MPGWWDDDDEDEFYGEWMPWPDPKTLTCTCWRYRHYGRCQHLVLYRKIVELEVSEKYL